MADPSDVIPQIPDNEIPEEFRELIKKAGGKEVALRSLAIAERYSGPVPHPRMLQQYKDVMADAPERIFGMAEKQQEHRMDLEKSVIKSDIHRADTGLILGFILFLVLGVGAILLLALGKNLQGFALLGTSLIGGIGNFIRVGRERAKTPKAAPKQTPHGRNRHKKKSPV